MPRFTDLLRATWTALRRPARAVGGRRPHRLRVEALEDRAVPATFVVDTLDYPFPRDGTGVTLWEAIERANQIGDPDTIVFADSLAGGTIHLSNFVFPFTSLPTIISDVTIIGLGADRLTIDADGDSRVFEIAETATAEIRGLSLTGGDADSSSDFRFGGAILNRGTLTVADSVLSGNTADSGGAIFNFGTLSVTGSTLSGNSADSRGGGISNHGTLTVTDSTLSGNTTDSGGASVDLGGGGIFNFAGGVLTVTSSTLSSNSTAQVGGGIANHGRLAVINSTLSGNSAWREGGGIFTNSSVRLTVTNSTIVLNQAGSPGGGMYSQLTTFSDPPLLNNTIVAGNFHGTDPYDHDDLRGTNVDPGSMYNLIGSRSSSGGLQGFRNGNIVGGGSAGVFDPVLRDNGGPTLTHALRPDGPAVNTGLTGRARDTVFRLLTTDQRGLPRVVGSAVDIGAYELQQVGNSPPAVGNFTLLGAEDNALAISAADIAANYSDPDGDPMTAVRIESLPANGTLTLDGAPVSSGQVIAAADLGGLAFVPDVNFHGEASFTYTASDGVAFAAVPATVTMRMLSAAEQAERIAARVRELVAVLTGGQAEALALHLRDNHGDIGKVQAFLNQVGAFLRAGFLPPGDANDLIGLGELLLRTVTVR